MSEPVTVLAALFIKGTDRKLHTTVICILESRDLPPSLLADGQSCRKGTASGRSKEKPFGSWLFCCGAVCTWAARFSPCPCPGHFPNRSKNGMLCCFTPPLLPLICSLIPGPDRKCLVMLSVLSGTRGPASPVSITQSLL